MNLIFLGPPGVGKGTQARHVCKRYGIIHLSTGDILRSEIKDLSEVGKVAKSYIDAGALVPDNVLLDIINLRLGKDDAQNGYLLDGFPRTIPQAEGLDDIMNSKKHNLDVVVSLVAEENELIQRLIAYDDQIKKNVLIKVNKVEDKYINIVNKINIYHPKNLIENFKMKHKEINTHLISFMELIYNKNIGKFNELLNRFHLAKKIMISRYNDYQTEIIQNSKMIKKLGNELYQDKSKLHRRLHQDLLSVNPASALKKGYSIIRNSEGKILKSKLQVHDNQILSAVLKDGPINLIKAKSRK